jgi:hypothetical protein
MPEQLIHVILPPGGIHPNGARYQYHEIEFPVGTPPEVILAGLAGIKRQFGTVKTKMKVDPTLGYSDPIPHNDPASGWMWDHPDTIVAIGHDDGAGNFVEDSRIKGPHTPTGK